MKFANFVFVILCAATTVCGQTSPVPFVNQPPEPSTATPGAPSFTLTVNGTGFVSGSVVNWNGNVRPTNFVSSSKMTATIAASDVVSPSTASVTVTNPLPGGGISNVGFFSITNATSAITLSDSTLTVGTGSS